MKKRSRNQTCMCDGFLIDFWSILETFWGPKLIKNRLKNEVEKQYEEIWKQNGQGSANKRLEHLAARQL